MDLLIYSDSSSVRLDYVFNHIFHRILGLKITITHDVQFFNQSSSPKINYSKHPFSDELFFYASDLLFEEDIKSQDISFSTHNGIKVFFPCKKGALPFDPFAASFYMLSRYEEYLPHKKDKMGRFLVDGSLAFKNNFLTTPVVDHWIIFIKKILSHHFPNLVFKQHKFSFTNTIDIDNAYAYLEKGFFRTLGATVFDLLKCNFKNIYNRINVLWCQEKDPYDNYAELLRLHHKYKLKTIFFFLLADYGFYDRNVHYLNDKFCANIQTLSSYCEVGVHNSVNSVKFPKNILIEINRLSSIVNKEILCSRQHFLYLNMPSNYRNLLKYGIKYDYSMGFPSHPGFRAGTSYDFYFFDLQSNNMTDLLLYPFSIMDVSLNNYLNLQPDEALDLIKQIIHNTKLVNGNFISIWHNESLSCVDNWKNWDSVYENMIKFTMDV